MLDTAAPDVGLSRSELVSRLLQLEFDEPPAT